ncbi:hypothetical protein PAHAL_6G039200 [Panicum hallii]|uniref:Uncharacterized protein n=1 Tax=Panicum hallii TaxID=206008 RepID=A0A2S3I0C5_9POAL|nr:hypothetical protein PAHAL_6G039200 [Panicum hallii]
MARAPTHVLLRWPHELALDRQRSQSRPPSLCRFACYCQYRTSSSKSLLVLVVNHPVHDAAAGWARPGRRQVPGGEQGRVGGGRTEEGLVHPVRPSVSARRPWLPPAACADAPRRRQEPPRPPARRPAAAQTRRVPGCRGCSRRVRLARSPAPALPIPLQCTIALLGTAAEWEKHQSCVVCSSNPTGHDTSLQFG